MADTLSSNLMKAVTGNYEINFKAMFQEAWSRVNGVKKPFWGAFFWGLLIIVGLGVLEGISIELLVQANFVTSAEIIEGISNIITRVAILLFFANLTYLMINHITGRSFRARMIFSFEDTASKLLGVTCVYLPVLFLFSISGMGIASLYESHHLFLTILATFLQIFLLIYVQAVGNMTLLLAREKKLKVLTTIKIAFLAITKRFFKNIFIYFAISIFVVASIVLTIGIGIIWVLPMQINFIAIWYRQIFGIEQHI